MLLKNVNVFLPLVPKVESGTNVCAYVQTVAVNATRIVNSFFILFSLIV